MLNPYIKHGAFLMEFDDRIKTIQGDWFISIENKTIKKHKKMITKKYHTIDVKRWYHIQRNCILIWKHNLNKSTHISLNFKLKTLNNPNGKCFELYDYINNYKWNIKKIYNNYVLNFKANQLKIIMNGNISLKYIYKPNFLKW